MYNWIPADQELTVQEAEDFDQVRILCKSGAALKETT